MESPASAHVTSEIDPVVGSVIERLRDANVPTPEVAEGAEVSERWVRMFLRGEIPNPGVLTLNRVAAFLDKRVNGNG